MMTRQAYADNIYESITKHINNYLSERTYTEQIVVAAKVKLKKNRTLFHTDSITGYTRVNTVSATKQYSVKYGDKGVGTELTFHASNIGEQVTISYRYKPPIMLSWTEMDNGIFEEKVSTPAISIEILDEYNIEYDQGMSSTADSKSLGVDLVSDVNLDGSLNVSQRDGIKEEIKDAFRSNIKFYDFTFSPASSSGYIEIMDRNGNSIHGQPAIFANSVKFDFIIKVHENKGGEI
jgi:hypothetical protein